VRHLVHIATIATNTRTFLELDGRRGPALDMRSGYRTLSGNDQGSGGASRQLRSLHLCL